MAEPYGTIAKYRNALAIKKHNAIIQPWASAMALDVAAVFWATWKGIEERLPEGDEILEAEKPRDSRDLKNKYSAIIRVEVKRHTAELQRVIEGYLYRVWLAGAVEQSRDLGCTGWFFSSLSKSSTSSESTSASDGTSLQEAPKVRNVKADKTGWVSLPNLRAQAYAKKHAAEAVTQINDTTRKEIARIVSDGVKSGASYNDIAKMIKAKFEEFAVPMPQKHIPNRAVLVAVTELANAYCEGNAQVGDYLQSNGVKMMKAWQTLEDSRVSDGCKENENVGWIPIDKEFPSGHMHPPRFPGCRCDFLQDILDEDMLGKPISDIYGEQYTGAKAAAPKVSGLYSPGENLLGSKETADKLYGSLLAGESTKEMAKLNARYYKSHSDATRKRLGNQRGRIYTDIDINGESYAIEYIVGTQGFDGLPKKISLSEFDESRGLYRGVKASDRETMLSYHNDFLNGTWYYSSKHGGSLYGRGMYTGKNEEIAKSYAGNWSASVVERMQFIDDAKIYTVGRDWEKKFSEFKKKYPEEAEIARQSCNDAFGLKMTPFEFEEMMNDRHAVVSFSDLIAAMGFDGMEIPSENYVLVFNRTALEVVDEDV